MQDYKEPHASVQQVLRQHASFEPSNLHTQKVLQRLRTCRTSAMGYHVYRCRDEGCAHVKYQYHSCRDRHCPQCGALKKQEWIEARTAELLPTKYYHVVFTVPHKLNSLMMGHRRQLFKLLFDASSRTLLRFAADPKYLAALPGIISVLHTWGQQLSFHPHVHCIVSGGGITAGSEWKQATKNDWQFLFPVKAMSKVYRGKFMERLKELLDSGAVIPAAGTDVRSLISILYKKDWVVYAKAPFGGPQAVIEYLGRYTHKVAISNHRIAGIDEENDRVSFHYKDYADAGRQKQMTLKGEEFIRRFEQHILPKGFTRIRTYGYLSNRNRRQRIEGVLLQMKLPVHKPVVRVPAEVRMLEQYGVDVRRCPGCQASSMELMYVYTPWKQTDDG